MKRRAFVAGIATLPFVASLPYFGLKKSNQAKSNKTNAVAPAVQTSLLNVYIHGLFASICDHTKQMFEIYPPTVKITGHEHVYRYGSWTPPACSGTSSHEPDMTKGQTYTLELTGYSTRRFPNPDFDSAAWISPNNTPNVSVATSKSYCTIELPPTVLVRPCHRISRLDGKPFFSGQVASDNSINPTHLARTFVFTYASAQPFTPALKYQGTTIWTPKSATDSLHFFAEPETKSADANAIQLARQAFDLLASMLGIDLHVTDFPAGAIVSEGDPAKEPQEEKGLYDRNCVDPIPSTSTGGGGGEVANCIGLFYGP